jgi:hypothetical protein
MADVKTSDLIAATAATASDALLLIQSNTSKKITVANLFAEVGTPVAFQDTVSIEGSETITASGSISVSDNITHISDPAAPGVLSIVSGTEGQLKIIVMIENNGSYGITRHELALSGSNVSGTITFSAVGASGTFIYSNDKWYMIGGTATLS